MCCLYFLVISTSTRNVQGSSGAYSHRHVTRGVKSCAYKTGLKTSVFMGTHPRSVPRKIQVIGH